MSRQLLQRLRRPASAHDRILQTGTMKSLSRSWKRSLSSSRMVRSRSHHSEPKFETATCAPRKSRVVFSSLLPRCVLSLSCAHG